MNIQSGKECDEDWTKNNDTFCFNWILSLETGNLHVNSVVCHNKLHCRISNNLCVSQLDAEIYIPLFWHLLIYLFTLYIYIYHFMFPKYWKFTSIEQIHTHTHLYISRCTCKKCAYKIYRPIVLNWTQNKLKKRNEHLFFHARLPHNFNSKWTTTKISFLHHIRMI